MNSVITFYKRIMLSVIIVGSLGINSITFAVCSPCQAAAAAREAARQAAAAARLSAQDAAAQSALLVNKPVVREVELDQEDPLAMTVVKACCSYCAETGQYCGGQNSARCTTCQEGLIKQSIADALAAALALTTVIVTKKKELDHDVLRAPRECIPTACDDCGSVIDDPICGLTSLLQELMNSEAECCAIINAKLDTQGKAAGKCCRKIKHELEDIQELVESQIDQSAECCSVIESMLTSVLDQQAACCSLVDSTLISVLDQQAACCSLVDSTLISVLDQQAACCSLVDSTLISVQDQQAACCSALEIQIINLSLSVSDIVITLQSVLDICLG